VPPKGEARASTVFSSYERFDRACASNRASAALWFAVRIEGADPRLAAVARCGFYAGG